MRHATECDGYHWSWEKCRAGGKVRAGKKVRGEEVGRVHAMVYPRVRANLPGLGPRPKTMIGPITRLGRRLLGLLRHVWAPFRHDLEGWLVSWGEG